MIPILYKEDEHSFSHNGIGALYESLSCDIYEAENGAFTMELEYPVDGEWFSELKEFRIIQGKPNDIDDPHNFRIDEIEKSIDELTVFIRANTITNDLASNLITKHVVNDQTPRQAMGGMKNQLIEPTMFDFISDIQTTSSTEWERINPLNAIVGTRGSVIDIWGGQIKRTNNAIYVYSRRGKDNVATMRTGKNIEGLNVMVSTTGIITKVLPIFTYRPIEIPKYEIVEKSDGERTKRRIPNTGSTNLNENSTVIGEVVTSQYVDNYPIKKWSSVDYSNDAELKEAVDEFVNNRLEEAEESSTVIDNSNFPDELEAFIKEKLDERAADYFTDRNPGVDLPNVQVRADVMQLSDSPEWEEFKDLERIGLTDTIDVWVEEYDIDVEVRVTELTYDSIGEQVRKFVAGNDQASVRRESREDAKYADLTEKLDDYITSIENGVQNVMRNTADGLNRKFEGYTEPPAELSSEGDIWFKEIGDGKVEIWIYDGTYWQPLMTEDFADKLLADIEATQAELEEAKKQAKLDADKALADAKAHADAEVERISTELSNEVSGAIEIAEQAKEDAVTKANQALVDAKAHADAEIALIGTHFDDIIEGVESDVADVKQTADDAVYKIDNDIANKFTSLDAEILSIETISNSAQANAQTALDQSQDALGDSSTALTNAQTALDRANTAISSASNAATLAGGAVTKADEAMNSASSALTKADEAKDAATILSGQVSGFETTVAGFNQTINNYEGQVSGFRNDILGLESTVANYESEVDEFGNTVSTYATEVSSLTNTVSGFESTVATYGIEVSNLAGEVLGYKNQVSTLNNTVSGLESTVAQYTTEVDEFGNTVSTYATEVSTMRNTVSGFESTVATYGNEVNNYATQVSTLTNTVQGFESVVSDVQYDLDNIEIGGRNLIPNSTNYSYISGYSGAHVDREDGVTVSEWGASDASRYRVSGGSHTIKLLRSIMTDTTEMNGVTYTWTIYAKNNGSISVTFNTNRLGSYVLEPGESKRIIITGSHTNTSNIQIQIRTPEVSDEVDVTLWRPQLEKGNIATDWTPAPEDMATATQVSELSNTIDGFQSKVTKVEQDYDGISGTVATHTSQISNLDGEIALKANTTTVNTLTGRVTTAETGITANANAIKLKASQSSVDTLSGRVSTAETSITANASAIKLKANTTTVNTLTGTVNTLSGKVDVTAGQISSKVWMTDIQTAVDDTTDIIDLVESDLTQKYDSITASVSSIDGRVATNTLNLDGLTTTVQSVQTDLTGTTTLLNATRTTVNEHTSTIATLRTDVDGKATTTQFNTLNSTVDGTIQRVGDAEGRLTTVETNINGLQTTVAGKASQSEVTQLATGLSSVVKDLDDLEVGGRNLLRNSEESIWTSGYNGASISVSPVSMLEEWGFPKAYEIITNGGSSNYKTIFHSREFMVGGMVPGQEYTFSLYIKNIGTNNAHISFNGLVSDSTYTITINPGESKRIRQSGVRRRDYDWFQVILQTTTITDGLEVVIGRAQLEKGNKATDWTPAPEDTQSQITQLSNNINLRVTKGEVLSQINIEAERTLIQSNKLVLDANSVVFTGSAFIPSAQIQSIHADKITAGTINTARLNTSAIVTAGLTANVIKSTHIETSTATINKIFATDAMVNTLTAKTAFINSVKAVDISAARITSGTISAARLNASAIVTAGLTANVVKSTHISADTALFDMLFSTTSATDRLSAQTAWIKNANIANASIQGAKIADATIGSGKIISLDVSRLSGNITNFVRSEWNGAVGGGVSISGTTGVRTQASSYEESRLQDGGVLFYDRYGTYVGKMDSSYSNEGSGGTSIFVRGSGHFSLIEESGTLANPIYDPVLYFHNRSSNVYTNRDFSFKGNRIVDIQSIRYSGGNAAVRRQGSQNVEITTHGEENTAALFGGTTVRLYRTLDMNGNTISNQSDYRLKRDIDDTELDSLSSIESWKIVDFNWMDEELDKRNGRQLGLVAQDTPDLAMYDDETDTWSINSSKQIMMNTHAIQQLALREQNINRVVESNESKIHKLQQELSKANRRIEELESVM